MGRSKVNRIIFRVDATEKMGLGHLTRCLALVDMLKDEFECVLAIKGPTLAIINKVSKIGLKIIQLPAFFNYEFEQKVSFDLYDHLTGSEVVVLDGYHFDELFQIEVKKKGCKLVCIDDLCNDHFVADVVINHALNAQPQSYSVEGYTRVYTGADYMLLRKEFLDPRNHIISKQEFSNVFICFGGSDFYNFTLRACQLFNEVNGCRKIEVVVGSGYTGDILELKSINPTKVSVKQNIDSKELIEIMTRSNFGIVSASGIAYEALSVRLPIITGFYVSHQVQFYKALLAESNVVGIGSLLELNNAKLLSALDELKLKYDATSRPLADGLQKERYLKLFTTLFNN